MLGTPRTPWRVDEDNERRIVVKDDAGNVVHHAEYDDIPTERGSAFREQIIADERTTALAMVKAVNFYFRSGESARLDMKRCGGL